MKKKYIHRNPGVGNQNSSLMSFIAPPITSIFSSIQHNITFSPSEIPCCAYSHEANETKAVLRHLNP